jgi:hypothetical protein
MLTSFRSDPGRITKEMQISSFPGKYALDTPGPGLDLPFMEDAQMRMQTWGANRCNHTVNLESDLRGMTRRLNRDCVQYNDYKMYAVTATPVRQFRDQDPFVLESRASHPAWFYRDLEQPRWEEPWVNPQANVEKKFHDNISTRILEKDFHKDHLPYPR